MTDRERFKAWASQEMGWNEYDFMRDRWGYVDPHTRRTEEIWKSARKQALEEALAACEAVDVQSEGDDHFYIGADACQDAIRTLATPEGEQG